MAVQIALLFTLSRLVARLSFSKFHGQQLPALQWAPMKSQAQQAAVLLALRPENDSTDVLISRMSPVAAKDDTRACGLELLETTSPAVQFVLDNVRSAPVKLIVLTFSRPNSLKRLLASLDAADYGMDRPSLRLVIDLPPAGSSNRTNQSHAQVKAVAQAFCWRHGNMTVVHQSSHKQLMGQWLSAWIPTGRADAAVLLEDDLQVSPLFYRWLKNARLKYIGMTGLAGFTLQHQKLLNYKGEHKGLVPPTNPQPYLHLLPGSYGLAPDAAVWTEFLGWVAQRQAEPRFRPYVEGLVTTAWFRSFEKQGRQGTMWTQWFIRFVDERRLYTLYPNTSPEACLVIHWREKGEHFSQSDADSFKRNPGRLVSVWNRLPAFPSSLLYYNWSMLPAGEAHAPLNSTAVSGPLISSFAVPCS